MGLQIHSPGAGHELQAAAAQALRDFSRGEKKSPKPGVLIVDDEALIRWSLAQMLLDDDYTVMEAGDGKQALAILKRARAAIAVVMLDYRLPDTTGLLLLSAIRDLSPDSHVVLMTAYGTTELMAEALRLGAVSVVDKPIEMQNVIGIVERARRL